MMRIKPMLFLSAGLVAAMLVAARIVGGMLPEPAMLPVHWNAEGQADGFAGKWIALGIAPAMAAAISLLFALLPSINPLRDGLDRSASLYRVAWAGLLALMAVTQLLPIGTALGWHVEVRRLVPGAVGVLLMCLGNVMAKSRRTWFVGIRTPWTMTSEDVWIATHRLGGKLMTAAGLVWLACALAGVPSAGARRLMMAALGLAIVAPIVWSCVLWRRETRHHA